MKNGFDARGLMLICALAGCIAGVGIDALIETMIQPNEIAKDNTLLREEYDGVFFDKELTPTSTPKPTETPKLSVSPGPTETPQPTKMPKPTITQAVTQKPIVTVTPAPKPTLTAIPTQVAGVMPTPTITQMSTVTQKPMPTLTAMPTQVPTPTMAPATPGVLPEQQAFTYPAEIFGQVPLVNRGDDKVTYFEFAMDLIETLEGEIRKKNLNEISLFTKFMLKAVFCGVDIQSLKINDAIPRRQAALALHLAAEVMEKAGTGTTARSAQKYVTDITGCSSAEKKAIAYLYERGIQGGYQKAGQCFRPGQMLTETECAAWFSSVREVWK